MQDFTKLECGCYVGFDVNDEPMWGHKCPLHDAAKDMYEVCRWVSSAPHHPSCAWGKRGAGVTCDCYVDAAKKALAKAKGK